MAGTGLKRRSMRAGWLTNLLAAFPVAAATPTVKVSDPSGKPVSDAVGSAAGPALTRHRLNWHISALQMDAVRGLDARHAWPRAATMCRLLTHPMLLNAPLLLLRSHPALRGSVAAQGALERAGVTCDVIDARA